MVQTVVSVAPPVPLAAELPPLLFPIPELPPKPNPAEPPLPPGVELLLLDPHAMANPSAPSRAADATRANLFTAVISECSLEPDTAGLDVRTDTGLDPLVGGVGLLSREQQHQAGNAASNPHSESDPRYQTKLVVAVEI